MNIKLDFNLGDLVFLKTDTDQKERMIVGIWVKPSGIMYTLNCGVEESYHYPMEITNERDWRKT